MLRDKSPELQQESPLIVKTNGDEKQNPALSNWIESAFSNPC
jgi:hypothetical protein